MIQRSKIGTHMGLVIEKESYLRQDFFILFTESTYGVGSSRTVRFFR
jgi:hypothetical protein